MVTTPLFCREVSEHAAWAINQVDPSTGSLNAAALRSITGRGGDPLNSFLDGFVACVAAGQHAISDLKIYLQRALDLKAPTNKLSEAMVAAVLTSRQIDVREMEQWTGWTTDRFAEVEEAQEKIRELRQQRDTFKHDRQVKAEAEALVVIRGFREGELEITGREDIRSAYFISNTHALDDVERAATPITIRAESALHLVSTLSPSTIEELAALTTCLMSELGHSGLAFIDRRRVQTAFSPLIDLSRDQLDAEMQRHEALLAERYGAHAAEDFARLDPLEAPLALNSLYKQEADLLSDALGQERRRVEALAKQASLSQAEREELDRLRAREQARAAEGRSRKRAARSQRGRRKKRRS